MCSWDSRRERARQDFGRTHCQCPPVSEFSTVSTALILNRLPDTFFGNDGDPRGCECPGFRWTAHPEPTRALSWTNDQITSTRELYNLVQLSLTALGFGTVAWIRHAISPNSDLKNSWCMSNHGLYVAPRNTFLLERTSRKNTVGVRFRKVFRQCVGSSYEKDLPVSLL